MDLACRKRERERERERGRGKIQANVFLGNPTSLILFKLTQSFVFSTIIREIEKMRGNRSTNPNIYSIQKYTND